MKNRFNKSEKEELIIQKFINNYKYKDYNQVIDSTLEIKQSDISEYETLLLNIIRSGISEKLSVGMLASRKIILERLIEADSPIKDRLNEYLQKVLNLLEN